MRADLRWIWSRLNSNYWFWPALFAILSVGLAVLMVYLDRLGYGSLVENAAWLVAARPSGASNMLTVIAGAMIGTAATVFSITIAAVAYASGNFGPRLLTNFMEDRGNQISLATFIGTFVYAVTVLRTVRSDSAPPLVLNAADTSASASAGFVPQLSLLVAYLLMALSIAVLVYFLNHIPSSIRINTVLEGIGERLLHDIDQNYPLDDQGGDGADVVGGVPVTSRKIGYIQLIDFEELGDWAKSAGVTLAMDVRTGNFVHVGVPLARIIGPSVPDDAEQAVDHALTFGSARTPTQDPQFLFDELVEIGLRALSPGINDPFTAITALHWLGAATAEIGRRNLTRRCDELKEGLDVRPMPESFGHFIRRGFGQMRSGVAGNPTAALVMYDTLENTAAAIGNASRRAMLREQGDLLIEQVREALAGPDLASVEARHAEFLTALASLSEQ